MNAPLTLTQRSSDPIPVAWVERLFEKLGAMFGARFADQWQGMDVNAVKSEWAAQLAGHSGHEIARGLDALVRMGSVFPPSLPEFRKLCRPWLAPESAFIEAVAGCGDRSRGSMGNWSHPAIYWAAQKVGPFDILNQPYRVIQARWIAALDEQFKLAEWQPIPEPRIAIPAPGDAITDDETARRNLAKIKQMAASAIKRPV